MTSKAFDHSDWIDRLAGALAALAKAQEPYLQAYWQHIPRKRLFVDGRDVTPFPLDDLRMVYTEAPRRELRRRNSVCAPTRAVQYTD